MKLSTSILSSSDRICCVEKLNDTCTHFIHIDVMDGNFVSNEQMNSIIEIKSIEEVSKHFLDIHLMVNDPICYIEKFENMNIEFISFHIEVQRDIKNIIDKIHSMGYKVGVAIKPNTDIFVLEKYLDDIDLILVMSVEPGYGGQKFILNTVNRIRDIKKLIGDRNILVEVDGGINDETIKMVKDVDIVVVGSFIVNSDDYSNSIDLILRH